MCIRDSGGTERGETAVGADAGTGQDDDVLEIAHPGSLGRQRRVRNGWKAHVSDPRQADNSNLDTSRISMRLTMIRHEVLDAFAAGFRHGRLDGCLPAHARTT